MGHFKTVCSCCGTVIAQCRCPGPKKVSYETCAVCKRRQEMVDEAVGADMPIRPPTEKN